MKIKYLIFLFFMLFYVQQGVGQDLYVTPENGLNLRSSAGVGNNVVTKIPKGAKVEVLDNGNSEWYKIKYEDNDGFKIGYVSAQYLSEDAPSGRNKNSTRKSSSRAKSKSSSSSSNSSSRSSSNSSGSNPGNKNLGLGIRGGDPTGITLKKYFGNKALEISLGRPADWWHSDAYYHDRFRNHYNYYDQYNHYYYGNGHYYSNLEHHYAIALQVHYLVHKDLLEDDIEGLQFYYGGGVQLRNWSYSYYYQRWVGYPNGNGYWMPESARVNDVDLGVDFVVGLEYTIPDIPVSFFLDANLYTQFYDRFDFIGQFGIGGRFNF